MPVIRLDISKLSIEKKRELAQEFTETASRITGIPKEKFYFFIDEHCDDNISIGGILKSDRDK